jgi:UDP:flavonoid glycosyltransferase YjiC (YdhE family)
MSRILLAWEVGAAYGHLMRFAVLARELARRGHEPVFALRDLGHADVLLRDDPFRVFQAPVWLGAVSGLPPPAGLAETLLRMGFLHPQALSGLCRAWRTLIDAVAPDLILCDYAPSALLATRGLRIPRVVVGESFASPPRSEPLPPYRWWRAESPLRLAESERHALAGANAALARLGQPPLSRLADLLDADDEILTMYAEFDQYPGRSGAVHWGPVAGLDLGVSPPWPATGGRRVFAYLKPRSRDFDKLLQALRTLDVEVVVHAPGISTNLLRQHLAANIRFSAEPVRMAEVCREAGLGLCHAGASTTQALVAAGIPVLLLPEHLEQMMTAKRVAELGAGLVVDYEKPAPDFKRLLRRLLDEPSFAEAAQRVAARYADDDPAARVARIAERCEALIASHAAR